MEILTLKTKDLTPQFQIDGISLQSEFKNIERFYGIPAALHTVDKKFGTTTYLDVVRAATPELNVLVEDNMIQLLDPKSRFIGDAEFDEAVGVIEKNLHVDIERKSEGFQKVAIVHTSMEDDDHYLNDAFSRRWMLTRRPEGGISMATQLMRLACKNGMVVPDKEYQITSRVNMPTMDETNKLHATVMLMKVSEYLEQLFTQDGEQVPCSFADMLEMQKTLMDLTQNETLCSFLFPIEGIRMFYASQGIETEKLARKWLDKLPTGFTYYQALQILTNGAKQMTEPTIENQVKVAKFCAPKRMKNLKDTNLHWTGAPKWTASDITQRMGDE